MEKEINNPDYDFKQEEKEVKEVKDYTKLTNYYFDVGSSLRPYAYAMPANIETLPPSNALRDEPEFKQGFYPCEKDGKWVLVADYRGSTMFNKETAEASEVIDLGEIPDTHTLIKPEFDHPKWDGDKWVEDTEAVEQAKLDSAKAEKSSRLAEADQKIHDLNELFEFELNEAGDDEKLKNWRRYRALVTKVDINNPKYPKKPA